MSKPQTEGVSAARLGGVYCILSRADINKLLKASQQSRKNGWTEGYISFEAKIQPAAMDVQDLGQIDMTTIKVEAW